MISLLLAAALLGDPSPTTLKVTGNRVLATSVYRTVAWQGGAPTPDAEGAALVQKRVMSFLSESGYVLARVVCLAADGGLSLMVDEGLLSRVVVHGQGAVGTLGAKISLSPPEDVFNQALLEETLRGLEDGVTVLGHRYEVVEPEDKGPGLLTEQLPISQSTGQELHVYLIGPEYETGVSASASVGTDSLRLGGEYRDTSALLASDRWLAGIEGGGDYFRDLERGTGGDMRLSRGHAYGRWMSPPLGVPILRGWLEADELWKRGQRRDLGVTTYSWNEAQGSAGLELVLTELLSVHAGLGVRNRRLFGIDQPLRPAGLSRLEPLSDLDAFWRVGGQVLINPGTRRLDRRHTIDLDARVSTADAGPWSAELAYRGVVGLGWDDLGFSAAAAAVGGHITVAEAIPSSSRYLRGVFGQRYYMDRVGTVSGEARLSVYRDLLKIGGFTDVTVFHEQRSSTANTATRVGLAAGPGIFALLLDTFQLDVYYAFGVVSDGAFDHNVFVRLEKAY